MFLEALIARSRLVSLPNGYATTTFRWKLKIREDGAFLGFEGLEPPVSMTSPSMGGLRTSGVLANTGLDNFTYLLGAGEAGKKVEWVRARHNAYREALAGVDHPAARAIEAFLGRSDRPLIVPTPAGVSKEEVALTTDLARAFHPAGSPAQTILAPTAPNSPILIEVEGHPGWYLSEAVARAHAKRLEVLNAGEAAPNTLQPQCSLCYERRPAVRVFPRSSRLGAALISFNEPSSWAYGREQGHNVPTCADCATGVAVGLDHLLGQRGTSLRYAEDRYLLWWSDDPEYRPFDLLETALSDESSAEDALRALRSFQDGYLASVEVAMRRGVLRRFSRVSGSQVEHAVSRWIDFDLPSVYATASSLTPSGAETKSEAHILLVEQIYLALLAAEPVPRRTTLPHERWLKSDPEARSSFLGKRRAAFLEWAGVSNVPTVSPSPTSPTLHDPAPQEADLSNAARMRFNVGRCFARLDTLQQSSKSRRPIRQSHYMLVFRQPERIFGLVEQYGYWRTSAGAKRSDRTANEIMQRVGDTHAPVTATERDQFHVGFHYQKAQEAALRNASSSSSSSSSASPQPDSTLETP